MTSPDLGLRHARTHDPRETERGAGVEARRRARGGLVPIWCGVVLLAVATTLVPMPGAVLAVSWAAAWLVSSIGLGLVVLTDEPSRREHRPPAQLGRP